MNEYLKNKLKKNKGWLPISDLTQNPRVKALTDDVSVIVKVLKSSDLFKVSDDSLRVKGKIANIDSSASVVYIFGFPTTYNLDNITAFFTARGLNVKTIRMEHKAELFTGFALVGFASPDEAQEVVKKPLTVDGSRLFVPTPMAPKLSKKLQFYARILKQVEFYFSDSYLPRDQFLKQELENNDGWLPISVLATFPRVKAVTESVFLITQALKKPSGRLEISTDYLKVRRKTEVPKKLDNSAIVFITGFPTTYTINKIYMALIDQGLNVKCIRMDRENNLFTGSIYAELSSPFEAQKALNKTIQFHAMHLFIHPAPSAFAKMPSSSYSQHAQILKQVEFYFSDSNLPRDQFLKRNLKKNDGWLPISILTTFSRLKALSEDVFVIAEALKSSDLLEVSEDSSKVKRKTEVPKDFDNFDSIVFIRGFPPTYNLDKIYDVLTAQDWNVKCVRMYRRNNIFNGSVLAELASSDEAHEVMKKTMYIYHDSRMIRLQIAPHISRFER